MFSAENPSKAAKRWPLRAPRKAKVTGSPVLSWASIPLRKGPLCPQGTCPLHTIGLPSAVTCWSPGVIPIHGLEHCSDDPEEITQFIRWRISRHTHNQTRFTPCVILSPQQTRRSVIPQTWPPQGRSQQTPSLPQMVSDPRASSGCTGFDTRRQTAGLQAAWGS